jgi:hypothetical protein
VQIAALKIGLLLIATASLAPVDRLRAEAASTVAGSDVLQIAPDTSRASLAAIANWLSDSYGLPRIDVLPNIELVPPGRLAALRYRGLLPDRWQFVTSADVQRQVVAVYDDARRTIYLPEGWTGATLAERSILVHEMVHHLQNLGGLTFECAGAREKVAYEAQDDWLKARGGDLEKEFETDMFTILIAGACMN